jgi:fatty acid desaturase
VSIFIACTNIILSILLFSVRTFLSVRFKDIESTQDDSSKLLTVIRGKVYDLSTFYPQHPGGDLIRLASGMDASVLFESYHPSWTVSKLEQFQVGVCDDTPEPANINQDFWTTLRGRVEKYLATNKQTRQLTWVSLAELIVTISLAVYAWSWSAMNQSWIGAVCLGFCYARLGFIMHMGIHTGAAAREVGWLNKVHGACMDLIGGSSCIWKFEHNLAHHCYSNELHRDNDCEIANPALRMHPGLPRRWWHSFQVLTVCVGMMVGLIKWVVSDVKDWANGFVGNVKVRFTRLELAQMAFFKTFFFCFHFALPYYFHGNWSVIFRNFFITLILGAEYMENIFITSHIQKGCVPDEREHWAAKQVLSTCNWGSASPFWNWFSGGLNHQIEHHLFPSLAYYHYAGISPIVKRTCEEFKLPYRNFSSLPVAMYNCYSYLHELGNNDVIKMSAA